jgi:signal transduction histidine kinase/CheY-like chemotaxis protein
VDRRIVICAPTGQDAVLATRVFDAAGLASIVCRDSAEVLIKLQEGAGALLLVEEVVSGRLMDVLSNHIAAQPTWSDLPVLLLTRNGADSADVRRAVEHLGNVTLLERPVRTIALIAATRSAIRARERQYQVRDADQRKDEFLATLAHELRNPLAPIRTSMGILANVHPDSRPVTDVRNVVNRQVTHLTRLVDDLLDVARITTGKVVLKHDFILLQSVIDHAIEISSSLIEARQHRLDVDVPSGTHVLYADQARLVQSLANLLVNAAKFTPTGGRITLSGKVSGDTVVFSVRDNGIGMDGQSLNRVFELFAQTPVPGEAPAGLGIGLSLARQFSEMHGGTLGASSDGLGKGSCFVLTLPVVRQDAPLPDLAPAPAPPPAPAPLGHAAEKVPATNGAARKILVVDDNEDAANTLELLLDMDGFKVTTVYNGVAAVAAAEAETPDVIIMDIGMPGMDGYDAARTIRSQANGRDMKLIALTGWGQSTDKKRATEAGFNHHLVKPVDYATLMSCLG